jgi:hypothetical protein
MKTWVSHIARVQKMQPEVHSPSSSCNNSEASKAVSKKWLEIQGFKQFIFYIQPPLTTGKWKAEL